MPRSQICPEGLWGLHRIISVVCGSASLRSRSSQSMAYRPAAASYASGASSTLRPLLRIELKKMLYTGVWMTTFSAGVVSLRTMLEIAGITPVQKISESLSKVTPWRSRHQPI